MINLDIQQSPISQTVAGLKSQGYQLSFRRDAASIYCIDLQEPVMPDDFTVDELYYFEDPVHPDAERILYAISLANGSKGLLVDTSNVYSDNISYEMEQKLQWQYPKSTVISH